MRRLFKATVKLIIFKANFPLLINKCENVGSLFKLKSVKMRETGYQLVRVEDNVSRVSPRSGASLFINK